MAASTKVARRLGRNDMANTCEVLINLVSENKRKVLKLAATRNAWPKRDAARRDATISARHTGTAVGEKGLPKSFTSIGLWN